MNKDTSERFKKKWDAGESAEPVRRDAGEQMQVCEREGTGSEGAWLVNYLQQVDSGFPLLFSRVDCFLLQTEDDSPEQMITSPGSPEGLLSVSTVVSPPSWTCSTLFPRFLK